MTVTRFCAGLRGVTRRVGAPVDKGCYLRVSVTPSGQTVVMPELADSLPEAAVLRAYGLAAPLVALRGGQRRAWRCGHLVLKPLDTDLVTLAWLEATLHDLDGHQSFRVAPLIRSESGDLTVHGWTAWRFEAGQHHGAGWADVIRAGDAFHQALRAQPRPAFLDDRQDPWAAADRAAWHEVGSGPANEIAVLAELHSWVKAVDAQPQVIHGDLTHNVLFADGLAPLVLDLSPYWRPSLYAAAIVVADALVFADADLSSFDAVTSKAGFDQYLLRALLFRATTDWLNGATSSELTRRYQSPTTSAIDVVDRDKGVGL